MNKLQDQLAEHVTTTVTPDPSEVRQARAWVMDRLSDAPVLTVELIAGLAEAHDLSPVGQHKAKITAASVDDFVRLAGTKHPIMAARRWMAAAAYALADLASAGLVQPFTPAASPPAYGGRTWDRLITETIQWQVGNTGSGTHVALGLPQLATGYRLAFTPPATASPTLFTVEGYVKSLRAADVPVTARAERCINEALRAWSSNLPLSCVSMLGAATENVWLTLARDIASPKVAQAAGQARPVIARVQDAVGEYLRGASGVDRFLPDALATHARLMRELRNYGIHGDEESDLDPLLLPDALTGLFASTHQHLTQLSRAVTNAAPPGG